MKKIKDSIDKKLNSDLSNVDKKQWWKANVSKSSTNQLEVLDDGYYIKSGGGGEIYDGDGKSIVKDDKNIFTAISLKTGDLKYPYLSGHDAFVRGNIAVANQNSIAQLFIKDTNNVKNDKLKDVVIKDGIWKDNILQIVTRVHVYQTDNGEMQVQTDYFYAPPTKGKDLVSNTTLNNQIKLDNDGKMFVEPVAPIVPKDLIDSQDGNQITTGKDKKLYVAQTVLPKWKLLLKTNDFFYSKKENSWNQTNSQLFKKYSSLKMIIYSDAYGIFSMPIDILEVPKTTTINYFYYFVTDDIKYVLTWYCQDDGSFKTNLICTNDNSSRNLPIQTDKIYLYVLENVFEPIPPIPPTPHPTKSEQYNAYKEIIKTDGRY